MTIDALGPRLAGRLNDLAAAGREPGGSLCLITDEGSFVATTGDDGRGGDWRADTLVMTYSCAKPLVGLSLLTLVADGLLVLDQPVSDVWPEYAAHGKQATTIRQLLSHQAGQPAFPEAAAHTAFDDRVSLTGMLADAPPEQAPGSGSAEHALTYGHLCDEVIRRVCGESLGERFARIASVLGRDLHLQLDDAGLARTADVVVLDPSWVDYLEDPRWGPALSRPPGLLDPELINSERFRRHCFGAISLHASAQGLAGFFADLAGPEGPVAELLGRDLHRAYLSPQVDGVDAVIGSRVVWTLGPQLDTTPDGSFELGMGGVGGSAGWVRTDPAGQLVYAFAYVSRGLGGHERGDQLAELLDAHWPAGPG
jgi:CubicO group peptidase (beta-lactamase class C family)